MIDATHLDLIGLGEHGLYPPVKVYRVQDDARTWLRADTGPRQFKMVPIDKGQRGPARWIARENVSH